MLKDIRSNPIMLSDTYNLSHQNLKVSTDWEVSHIYNRTEGMILYGFNEIVQSVLNTKITMEMVNEAEHNANKMGLNFPRKLFVDVVKDLGGFFPLLIQSLPEGSWIPKGTPFAQVRNTVEGFGELVTWVEGIFLHSSFPCGTATEAFKLRRYAEFVNKRTGAPIHRIHSFGFRGHRSLEDAYWASTSWNLFLHGTDDFHSMIHTPNAKMGSISALAHKVTQQYDVEYDGYIHTIDATAKVGEKIVAIVIDTYDADRFIGEYLVKLANYAKNKEVHLVIRPDSGDVLEQIVAVYHKTKSYNLENVSVILGEGMSLKEIDSTDFFLRMRDVPLPFVSYGIGGGFYNHINRDTLGFAMKTAFSNGRPRMKFGMDHFKRSIPDKVAIIRNDDGELVVEREKVWIASKSNNLYETIYQFDKRFNTPFNNVADWNETQERAMKNVHIEDLQDRIILSDSINDLVKEFEKVYA